jgi:hypothetical protein
VGYFLLWRKGVYGILTGSKAQALQVHGKISTLAGCILSVNA